ncbi:hypothetical protein BOTBODRAFT_180243 [Botryobasidium botryosum FD-172 SS1]|uniref:Protein kinase domain-containing protein n=1 Tax=Botryobasidium botryosum (strain FD-172 SS1) TaxID=930990 RepID=A0A067M8U9_BOTB1|nr:hypothetical protein BOTBODRAFT_180243 [Botryobasidium botryosum FD-172 SS1]
MTFATFTRAFPKVLVHLSAPQAAAGHALQALRSTRPCLWIERVIAGATKGSAQSTSKDLIVWSPPAGDLAVYNPAKKLMHSTAYWIESLARFVTHQQTFHVSNSVDSFWDRLSAAVTRRDEWTDLSDNAKEMLEGLLVQAPLAFKEATTTFSAFYQELSRRMENLLQSHRHITSHPQYSSSVNETVGDGAARTVPASAPEHVEPSQQATNTMLAPIVPTTSMTNPTTSNSSQSAAQSPTQAKSLTASATSSHTNTVLGSRPTVLPNATASYASSATSLVPSASPPAPSNFPSPATAISPIAPHSHGLSQTANAFATTCYLAVTSVAALAVLYKGFAHYRRQRSQARAQQRIAALYSDLGLPSLPCVKSAPSIDQAQTSCHHRALIQAPPRPGYFHPLCQGRRLMVPGRADDMYGYGTILGQGGFAVVHVVQRKKSFKMLALESIRPQDWFTGAVDLAKRQSGLREIQATGALDHERIIGINSAMHYYLGSSEVIALALEFVPGGSLHSFANKHAGRLRECHLARILLEVLEGLIYIHDRGVVHRDIKPENILLTETGRVRIADFGLADVISSPISRLYGGCGTPQFADIKSLESPYGYGREVDIYSLGLTADWFAKTGLRSYPFSENWVKFIESCMANRDAGRVTARQLINLPLFRTSIGLLPSSLRVRSSWVKVAYSRVKLRIVVDIYQARIIVDYSFFWPSSSLKSH